MVRKSPRVGRRKPGAGPSWLIGTASASIYATGFYATGLSGYPEQETDMYLALFEEHAAAQIIMLLFTGAAAGIIVFALGWAFWWTQRKRELIEKGQRYRARIEQRFDRLHAK
jgi:hypothetical protein